MILSLPVFRKQWEYYELPNKHMAKWRFKFSRDYALFLTFNTGIHAEFYDKNEKHWMTIDGNIIIIKAGYAWNGCSPKRCLFGQWVGTPDYKQTILASGIHDALCQFFNCEHFLLDKYTVDLIFYHIMKRKEFHLTDIYYGAVNKFGNYTKEDGEYSKEINYEQVVCAGVS